MKFLNTFLCSLPGWRLAKRNRRIVRRSGRKSPRRRKRTAKPPPPSCRRSTTRAQGRQTPRQSSPSQAHHPRGRCARQQAGGKNHPPAGRTRKVPVRPNRCSRPCWALVLAVFSAKPLSFHAAHRDSRTAWGGLHHVGSAATVPRNRPSLPNALADGRLKTSRPATSPTC